MGPTERSRHLPLLVTLALILLPLVTLLSGAAAFVPLALLPAAMAILVVMFGSPKRPPGSSDDEHGGGGGGGSPTPDKPNHLPGGGVPLPDAAQARVRYRGTRRSSLIPARERRRQREPGRRPVPHRVG